MKIKTSNTILYLLDIFPALSETFILNEILELERKGFNIIIFSRKKEEGVSHNLLNNLKAKVYYLPDAHGLRLKDIIISHFKVFCLHPLNYIRTFAFALERRDKGLFWFFKIAVFYSDLVKKYKFSRIHSHFASLASEYAMLIARLLGKPFTFTIHGIYDLYIEPPKDLYERASSAKKVVTISDYNKKYLINKFDIPEDKITVVHSGIDLNFFKQNAKEASKDKTILSVARLDPVKSLDTLIKACNILNKEKIEFKCIIVGEGRSRKELEALITELNLNDKVFLLGAKTLEEVRDHYKKAVVFVLPSKYETMGVTTMEAMASGLPVISTNIYGIPELVEHSKAGYLINPGDEEKLAEYLKELLSNENKCFEMGKIGRAKIEAEFNLGKEVNKLIGVFNAKS